MARYHLQPYTTTPIQPVSFFNAFSEKVFDYRGEKKINRLLGELNVADKDFFIESLLLKLNIQYNVLAEDLQKIPLQGAFAVVANHPFGVVDALLLLKIIKSIRADFMLADNGILKNILPASEHIIHMHPLEKEISTGHSFSGVNEVFKNFENGNAVGFFPSESPSFFQPENNTFEDGVWNHKIVKIIQTAEVPVLPIYFEGNYNKLYHVAENFFAGLKKIKFPSEILQQKESLIKVRIGAPIPLKQLKQFGSTNKLARFLRAKTYGLKSAVKVKKFYLPVLKKKKNLPQEIAPAINKNLLTAEIEMLKQQGHLLLSQQNFEVYIAGHAECPQIMAETGRLREITFREVGEGTGLKYDLDEYDLYYKQLILWDTETQSIAGGYRLGLGDYIIQHYGIKGFYTRSLFKIDNELLPVLQHSVELGRSYVVKAYQQKRLPLFLLWKGILTFLQHQPQYQYLFGPVSISNKYNDVSKTLIIEFIKRNYFDNELAKHIKPRKKYAVDLKNIDIDILVETAEKDIKLIDRYIQDFDPCMNSAPVLLKKYLNQNAKIAGFNTDPKFSDVIDGLMFLNLKDLPPGTVECLQ